MTVNFVGDQDATFGATTMGVQRMPLKEIVAAEIRRQIFSGEMPPNSKIDQDRIARSLDISRHPVREALITLEGESLVVFVARRGAFVAPLTPDDILDHYRIFGLVSGIAAERAVERFTEEQIQQLERTNEEMDRAADARERERLNYEFHRTLNRAGASLRLSSVLRMMGRSAPASYESHPDWAVSAVAEHREIIRFVREGRAKEAGAAMAAHLERAGQFAVEHLRSMNLWQDGPGQSDPEGDHHA